MGSLKWEGSVVRVRNDVHRIGLGHIWLDRDLEDICQTIKTRYDNIQRQPHKEKAEESNI